MTQTRATESIRGRGGRARAEKLTPEQRQEISRHAAKLRWDPNYQKPANRTSKALPPKADMADALRSIRAWCESYPLDVFPEPDIAELRRLCGEQAFAALHASWARHLLSGIARYAEAGLGLGEDDA